MKQSVSLIKPKLLATAMSAFFISATPFVIAEEALKNQTEDLKPDEVSFTSTIDTRILKHPAAVEACTKKTNYRND